MFTESAKPTDFVTSGLVAKTLSKESSSAGGVYHVQCFGSDGKLKWEDSMHNLVTSEGLQNMNTQYFTGSSYTAEFYLGLIVGPGGDNVYVTGDTLASHAGWVEFDNYSGARKAVTFGSATTDDPSSIDSSGSPSSFTISGDGGVVAGAFLCTVSSGTSGVLFSAANFQSPGDRTVIAGDTLNVTYAFSISAA